MKSYTIALDKDEQSLAVPFCLHRDLRVAHAKYTWRLFLGAASPNTGSGSQGDVWVTTIPGHENVYIRGEGDEWNVWHKSIDYGQKRYCNDKNKFIHSYHPWLRDRLLQFNGTDLGWHPRRLYNYHRLSWNAKRPSGHPEYESLDSVAVARYVKAVHLPRPTLFGGVQPAASTSSSSVPPVTAARPAQPVQPTPPRPTVPGGVQLAAPSSSRGLQPATAQPAQQVHAIPKLTVPGGVQPVAQTSLPSVTTARPAPPRPVAPGCVQPAAPSSSATFSPVAPGQPPLRGPTFTGVGVQPAPPTSSLGAGPAPLAQPTAPKPTIPGAVQPTASSSTSSLRPTTALPAQPAFSLPPEPPKYEDIVSETRVKRRRSSSPLSYASKEQSPLPKRPKLGKKVGGSSNAIRDQPPHLSRSRTTPVGIPPTSVAPPTATAAPPPPAAQPPPAPVIVPSSSPVVQPSPVPAIQPSPVPVVPTSPATALQSSPATAIQPSPTPIVQPPPTPSVPSQISESATKEAEVPTKPCSSDAAATGSIPEEAPNPPDPASIEAFLSGLPLSLSHHAAVFTAVGVANMDHFRLLAQLPKRSLDKFLAMVRERGLSFMESLILRSALNGLRQPSVDLQAQADPTTIEAWLEQIGPSMVRHAQVFRDLGIDFEHVPVLAQLDAETFQEFEKALDTAGLAWIDRFVITAKIRDGGLPDVKQEPLLVA